MNRVFLPVVDNGMRLVHSAFAVCLLQAFHRRPVAIETLSYPYPLGAMDIISNHFLKTDCERMLIIDGDMVFTRADVDNILSHNVDMVGAIYAKKLVGLQLVMSCETDNPWKPDPSADGVDPLIEVEWVGRGFLNIHRRVFETIAKDAPEYELAGEKLVSLWGSMPGGHSEDRFLCERWRGMGGKVYVDQRVTLGHEGQVIFPIKGTY